MQPFASFDWISPKDSEIVLGDDIRLPKLLRRLQDCKCDFICVQELQLVRARSDEVFDPVSNNWCSSPKQTRIEHSQEGSSCQSNTNFHKHNLALHTSKPQFTLPNWISLMTQANTLVTTSSMENIVYSLILPEQNELKKIAEWNQRVLRKDAAVTNAIFYRSDKLKPVSCKHFNGSTTACVMQVSYLSVKTINDKWAMSKQKAAWNAMSKVLIQL